MFWVFIFPDPAGRRARHRVSQPAPSGRASAVVAHASRGDAAGARRWPATNGSSVRALDDSAARRGAPHRQTSRWWSCPAAGGGGVPLRRHRPGGAHRPAAGRRRAVQRAAGRTDPVLRASAGARAGRPATSTSWSRPAGHEPDGQRHLGPGLRHRGRAQEEAAQAPDRDADVARAVPGVVPALAARRLLVIEVRPAAGLRRRWCSACRCAARCSHLGSDLPAVVARLRALWDC